MAPMSLLITIVETPVQRLSIYGTHLLLALILVHDIAGVLVDEGESSVLSISVRNPSGDLTKGFAPAVPRHQQPLTYMAERATQGQSGLNVDRYRDYRGVNVLGAWLWDDTLDIGLVTDIDQEKALNSYYSVRRVVVPTMGITVVLALGSLLFASLIDERARRSLQKSHDELEQRVRERTAELRKLSQAKPVFLGGWLTSAA